MGQGGQGGQFTASGGRELKRTVKGRLKVEKEVLTAL